MMDGMVVIHGLPAATDSTVVQDPAAPDAADVATFEEEISSPSESGDAVTALEPDAIEGALIQTAYVMQTITNKWIVGDLQKMLLSPSGFEFD